MRDLTRQEDGFTLVELLVAMSLSLIVLFATLQSLDAFSSHAAQQTRVTDANDQVRTTMDRVVRDLRGASVITTATATDLAYSVPDPTGFRAERICVAPADTDLYRFRQMNSVPTGACASGTKVANLKSTTNTAFTYDGASAIVAPATAATVKNVGLSFSLDASGGGRSGSSTLKASAAVRRTVAMLPIGPGKVPIGCSEAGPVIKIGIGVGFAEDVAVNGVGALTVSYTTNAGVTIAGGAVNPTTGSPPTILPPGITTVVVRIVDALGMSTPDPQERGVPLMIRRLSQDESGSALITALMATILMLGLGFALLSIVDTQASESSKDRSRDRAFNLTETVLTSQAFVLGRSWPTSAPAGSLCKTAGGFNDTVGNTAPATADVARVRRNVNASYDPTVDPAYTGATWQVHLCDDDPTSTVWSDALLGNVPADANGNNKLWVHAQSTVEGRTRVLVGLVRAQTTPALNARYALVAGGLADDLGSTLNSLTNQGVLGKLLHDPPLGLLDTVPTVASDPTPGAAAPNGVTGVRCGALDIKDGSTCVLGTLGAAGAIPLVSSLVTGGRIENFPGTTSTSDDTIARLRAQARASGTYTAVSAGSAPAGSGTVLNPNDKVPASVAACTITGSPTASTVVFIEQVGSGTPNAVGGPGDQYCSIDVTTAKHWKAIVVASGRVVIRGDNTSTLASDTSRNTFKGVVYALNLQRLVVPGIGDAAAPGREVVRIDRGAHIRGAVNADGKSAKVGIYPPPITINTTTLVNSLLCPGLLCASAGVIIALTSTLGVTGVVDALINGYCLVPGLFGGCTLSLPPLSQAAVVDKILAQATPQRTAYGSAITADVAAINALTVYGDSNLIPGSFRDLQAR